jgi:rhamnose utilization protein RhaD (predicted bifunctional aldolase and dehydrogenase)
MWIKASGTWLMDSLRQDNFVPLDLPRLAKALDAGDPDCESCLPFVRQELNPSGLRPSIETSVHGLMRQAVVVHVHCVDTIAWAIEAEAEQHVAKLLAGHAYAFVPYARPGLELAGAIKARIRPDTSVLILQNHGLVVAADTVESASELLADVRRRMRRAVRTAPAADIEALQRAAPAGYAPAADPETHALATDPLCLGRGKDHVFYPDHAVFLGVGVATDASDGAPLVAIEGLGVLISSKAARAIEPMGRCLADVLRRVPAGAALNPLPMQEIARLLNWDAEKYRQSLSRQA